MIFIAFCIELSCCKAYVARMAFLNTLLLTIPAHPASWHKGSGLEDTQEYECFL